MIDRTSDVVDRISRLNLTGNIVPHEWFQHIGKAGKKGFKVDHLAALILADIIYWYRPSEKKSRNGKVTARINKFGGDRLQKSYGDLAELFCVSKRQVKAAVQTLVRLGLIKTVFKGFPVRGVYLSNVLYIVPVPEAMEKICAKDAGRPEYARRPESMPENGGPESPVTAVSAPVSTPETPVKPSNEILLGV